LFLLEVYKRKIFLCTAYFIPKACFWLLLSQATKVTPLAVPKIHNGLERL